MTSPNPIFWVANIYLSEGQLSYSRGHNKQFQVTYNSIKGMEDNQDVKTIQATSSLSLVAWWSGVAGNKLQSVCFVMMPVTTLLFLAYLFTTNLERSACTQLLQVLFQIHNPSPKKCIAFNSLCSQKTRPKIAKRGSFSTNLILTRDRESSGVFTKGKSQSIIVTF